MEVTFHLGSSASSAIIHNNHCCWHNPAVLSKNYLHSVHLLQFTGANRYISRQILQVCMYTGNTYTVNPAHTQNCAFYSLSASVALIPTHISVTCIVKPPTSQTEYISTEHTTSDTSCSRALYYQPSIKSCKHTGNKTHYVTKLQHSDTCRSVLHHTSTSDAVRFIALLYHMYALFLLAWLGQFVDNTPSTKQHQLEYYQPTVQNINWLVKSTFYWPIVWNSLPPTWLTMATHCTGRVKKQFIISVVHANFWMECT